MTFTDTYVPLVAKFIPLQVLSLQDLNTCKEKWPFLRWNILLHKTIFAYKR